MKKSISALAAATMAMAAGMMSSPSGQEVVQTVADGVQVTQGASARTTPGSGVAQAQRAAVQQNLAMMNPYIGLGGDGLYYRGDGGLSPKEYGIYLLRSGKNKYNNRKRKHYAKMRA